MRLSRAECPRTRRGDPERAVGRLWGRKRVLGQPERRPSASRPQAPPPPDRRADRARPQAAPTAEAPAAGREPETIGDKLDGEGPGNGQAAGRRQAGDVTQAYVALRSRGFFA